jgi:hypothetical protein
MRESRGLADTGRSLRAVIPVQAGIQGVPILRPPPFSCHFPAGGNPDFLCENELFVEGHSRAGENPRVLLVR